MLTVLKTSWDFANFDGQIMSPPFLEYDKQADGTGDLSFKLPIGDESLETFTSFKKVSLYRVLAGADTLIWSGFVSEVKYNFKTAEVKCRAEKDWLKYKILYSDKNWSAVDFKTCINEILGEMNTRKHTVEQDITLDSSVAQDITKKFVQGDLYFDIVEEIVKLIGAEWDMIENEIIIATTLGEDRTSGSEFFELVSSTSSPNENTIADGEYSTTAGELATAIIGKGKNTYSQQDDEVLGTPRVEKFVSYSEGDTAAQVTEELGRRRQSQRVLEVKVVDLDSDFVVVNLEIGDTIRVRIERGNTILDTVESVRIVSKKVTFLNQEPKVQLGLAGFSKKVESAVNFFSSILKDIRKLQTGV